jgi:pimeloyl-ACP methyl ester carboxylesterase
MAKADIRRLKLWQGRIDTEVEISGSGAPLVYLHGPWGLGPDRGFAARLAEHYIVYAPKFPGTSEGNPDAVHALADWHDLVIYQDELLDALDLKATAVAGHSFGGLLACEIAAAHPPRVTKLVLIDPVGLWRDDSPVKNWMIMSAAVRKTALFADSNGAAAKAFFDVPADGDARVETLSQFIWAQACTGKFVWPIADRGLGQRIHRIAAPTLIVWGQSDGVIAPAYADEFARRIASSRIALIHNAAHMPHLEQGERVAGAVLDFLKV